MTRFLALCLALLSSPALAGPPRVATDIAPVQSLAAQVMDGVGAPALVIQHGASPHSHQLRPSEAAALEAADVVFWVGAGLTPWMPDALDTLAPDAVAVELMQAPGTTVLPARDAALFDDHDDDHGHDHGDGHEGEALDPHAWLDPDNALAWLDAIASTLAAADPGNADAYRANAQAAQARIQAASADIASTLAPLRGSDYIVFHDAYQYFEARFALPAAGAISLSDATAPGAARVAEIRDHIARNGVACVFTEPQFNPGLIAAVLEGTSAKTAVLDPLGTDIAPGPDFYTLLMYQIADRISGCLRP